MDLTPGAASHLFGYRGRAGEGSPISSPWAFGIGRFGQGRTPGLRAVVSPCSPKHGAPKPATEDEPPWMDGGTCPCSMWGDILASPVAAGRAGGAKGHRAPTQGTPQGWCPRGLRASAPNVPDVPVLAALDGGALARQDLHNVWHCPLGHQLTLVSHPRTGLSASSRANLSSRCCKTEGRVSLTYKRPNLRLWVLLPSQLCGPSSPSQAQTGVP